MPTHCFFVHQGSKCLIYDEFSQNITIKNCLEFPKMGQSTDKNKLQLSFEYKFWHGTHAHDLDLRTVLALKVLEAACNMIDRKFPC